MTRQNVTEGVREIMSRPCPTCDGEGVIRSEETIAIEFERRLRDIVAEHPDVEAFLVQINPRVTAEFTGHSSRVLLALEAQTGKSFLFEGSEGLELDHFAITFQGTREEVEERALPFRQGDEVLVDIVEPHMYNVDDAVAKIDGYIISIAGAAPHVGEKRMVRVEEVGRTAASALLLDEAGEVVTAPERTPAPRRPRKAPRRAPRAPRALPAELDQDGGEGPADLVLASANGRASVNGDAAAPSPEDDAEENGLQSKPRRRGRRGGRRRSAAKANETQEQPQPVSSDGQ
jgi:ribonuclease G